MTRQLVIDDWVFGLTRERDYVDLTELSGIHGLKMIEWYSHPRIQYILRHLDTQCLFPVYHLRGSCYARIEILDTILTPEFTTSMSPDLLPDITTDLVDYMLESAGAQMRDDFHHISKFDTSHRANKKADMAGRKYREAEHRRYLVTLVDDALKELRTDQRTEIKEMLSQIEDLVPEINEIIKDIPSDTGGIIEGARKILRYMRQQDEQMACILNRVSYLRTAIELETLIHGSHYRLLLAQLMIHSSHKRWYES